jgi:quinol monooxygenase YgiN
MAVVRITRFRTAHENTDEMLAKRTDLITAVRASFSGLTEARLARLDDETWVDMWVWESASHAQTAINGAHALPETGAAFALTKDITAEQAEIADER